ncbi:unknown [Clostridium sp. CAG:448]|nr:unknown [Clostridium sp. CAG:448]
MRGKIHFPGEEEYTVIRAVEAVVGVAEAFIGQLRNILRGAAGREGVGGVRQKVTVNAEPKQGIAVVFRRLHFVQHNAVLPYSALSVRFQAPCLFFKDTPVV